MNPSLRETTVNHFFFYCNDRVYRCVWYLFFYNIPNDGETNWDFSIEKNVLALFLRGPRLVV